ncbi:MAG: protein-glutamate O-methyltransferase CheR [Spirochaetes bacterium]|nr:protein-glutamate O-methyltransferase CheR [Spirochaetota bacterium]
MFDKLKDHEFKIFRDIIYNESWINFTPTNKPILEIRLKERLKKLNIEKLEIYHKLILNDKDELKNLIDSVTTNLTNFFRYKVHFETLENHVLPDLKEKKNKTKFIRIWSAGCSTGEEAYSIAMVVKDFFDSSWKIEILASDISFNVLIKAKEGFYSKEKTEEIPKKYLEKYMIQISNGYYVKDSIKELIQFDYHNIMNEPTKKEFDIIFCRNVIIYFDAQAQQEVVDLFYNTMNKFGYFFIGHSESLFGMKTKFIFKKLGNACIYIKNEGLT